MTNKLAMGEWEVAVDNARGVVMFSVKSEGVEQTLHFDAASAIKFVNAWLEAIEDITGGRS